MKKTFIILICILALAGCDWFIGGKRTADNEPVYTPRKVWQTETNYCHTWSYPFESGGYGYYVEEIREQKHCRLVKIDLKSGAIMWRTGNFQAFHTDQGQKIGDYVYISLNTKETILVFNDDNGSLAATVSLNSGTWIFERRKGPYQQHTAAWKNFIFWDNYDYPNWNHGLMRFDTSRIDFSTDPETVQIIEPELVWHFNMPGGIGTNIVADNGIVFFLTTRQYWLSNPAVKNSLLVAINAQTKEVLWVTERDFGMADRENSLFLKDDRLYVIDETPSCYDVKTGREIFEKKIFEYTGASSILKGISWYDNKLYYTTQMYDVSIDDPRINNIICIDGDNGNFVWGALIPKSHNISTNPLVYNGKTYVVTGRGLRVYNAETGALLGVDNAVKNSGHDHNLLYNDMVIFPDIKSENANPPLSILTAIRAY